MDEIICKRCGATDHVRNGIVRGLQRYRCETCGYNFTMTPRRGKPPEMKAMALLLYAMGGMSFCAIARLLRISDVTVLNWVRDTAHRPPEPSVAAGTVIITFDGMWRFPKKQARSGGPPGAVETGGAMVVPRGAAGYFLVVPTP